MFRKRTGLLISILVCSIIVFGSLYVYFNASCISWKEKSFERNVEQYNKYPDLTIVEQNIRYSMIDMQ